MPLTTMFPNPQLLPLTLSLVICTTTLGLASSAEPIRLLIKSTPASSYANTPASVALTPSQLVAAGLNPAQLRLVEVDPAGIARTEIPVQFQRADASPAAGVLWWLLSPGSAGERRFELQPGPGSQRDSLDVFSVSQAGQAWEISESRSPVLRYNQGTVQVPPGVDPRMARGDYIMPLFGLHGEMLTDDYPKDHPHHRGLGWSWPVTRWGNEVRDIWAVVGVWARPEKATCVQTGPVFAQLHATNVWRWGDTNSIVREEVLIRAFRRAANTRLVDVEIRLLAMAERVAIGGRPHGAYGGFGLRAKPVAQQKITPHSDPAGANPRRSWIDYSGIFAGTPDPSGLTLIDHLANPLYPATLLAYPELNYIMPAFPGDREVSLSRTEPLVLRYRVCIHSGPANDPGLNDVWDAYASPPKVEIVRPRW